MPGCPWRAVYAGREEMNEAATLSLTDRFRGCILGQAVGDAVAAPFEGMPADAIYYGFGSARKILAKPPVDELVYTDDTQMMIGIAETLIALGGIDEQHLCDAFVGNYDPGRGYGPGAREILEKVAAGGDWRELAKHIFPGGSLGNGAAMRAAPIGLLFHGDLDRVEREAERSSVVTHTHPVGIDGARLIALATALAMRMSVFNGKRFYAELMARAKTEEFRYQLSIASRLTLDDSVATLGNRLEADQSVVTAIACFTSHPSSYVDAVGRALGLGGDVDTLAAMTGALVGAHLGIGAVPGHLLQLLENGSKGRDFLLRLATDLLETHQRHAHGGQK